MACWTGDASLLDLPSNLAVEVFLPIPMLLTRPGMSTSMSRPSFSAILGRVEFKRAEAKDGATDRANGLVTGLRAAEFLSNDLGSAGLEEGADALGVLCAASPHDVEQLEEEASHTLHEDAGRFQDEHGTLGKLGEVLTFENVGFAEVEAGQADVNLSLNLVEGVAIVKSVGSKSGFCQVDQIARQGVSSHPGRTGHPRSERRAQELKGGDVWGHDL